MVWHRLLFVLRIPWYLKQNPGYELVINKFMRDITHRKKLDFKNVSANANVSSGYFINCLSKWCKRWKIYTRRTVSNNQAYYKLKISYKFWNVLKVLQKHKLSSLLHMTIHISCSQYFTVFFCRTNNCRYDFNKQWIEYS